MFKTRFLIPVCALVVLSLTLMGCPERKAGKEMAPETGSEAPASEMPAETEEMPMAPAEGEMEGMPMAPEGEEGE